jgi:two-component system KDP operon response regulator KdpE
MYGMHKPRVLLVDDDSLVVTYLQSALGGEGFDVVVEGDGLAAVQLALKEPFDIVVLDVVLPGLDGFEVCSRIRAESGVAILMLSVQSGPSDKVHALDLGADDYLSKPFALEEFLARVRSLMRRAGHATGDRTWGRRTIGDVTIDRATRTVSVGSEQVRLTPTEYSLFVELATNCGRVMTHRELLFRVWGMEYTGETEYLHVFVSRLRRKLAVSPSVAKCLATVPRVGYVLKQPIDA